MEIGVEAVDLEGILDIVVRRAVAVVVGIVAGCRPSHCVGGAGSGIAAQDIAEESHAVRRSPCCAWRARIEAVAGRDAILPRAHIELPDHAHLQVLGRCDMAVPEVSAGIRREVVIREAAADVDGDRGVGNAVVERRSVGIAVEVDRVLLEQIGPHDLAHVAEGEEEFVILIDRHQGRRDVAVHDADIHHWAGIHVSIDGVAMIHVGSQPDGAVIDERRAGRRGITRLER